MLTSGAGGPTVCTQSGEDSQGAVVSEMAHERRGQGYGGSVVASTVAVACVQLTVGSSVAGGASAGAGAATASSAGGSSDSCITTWRAAWGAAGRASDVRAAPPTSWSADELVTSSARSDRSVDRMILSRDLGIGREGS